MMRLHDIHVFVQAADAGSFSVAARQLDMTPALASNSIQRLEQELGARLFVRSTRSCGSPKRASAIFPTLAPRSPR
jgi:DNA-binding transcriptional LysR family regulator